MSTLLVRVRQALDRAAAPRAILIASVAAVFLALLSPFGTGAAPFLQRLVYWLSIGELGVGLAIGTGMAIRRLVDPDDGHIFFVAVLTAVSITLPIAAVAFEITKRFFQLDGRGGGFGPSGDLLGFVPPVLVICLALSLINALAYRRPVHTHAARTGAPTSRFDDRLPPRLKGAQIYAVQAEDHYLRLHTSQGSDLILMRLSDAIVELEGVEGAQTHRSWWVAKAAVQGARRANGRAVLELAGHLEAPVSRTYAPALRSGGWFNLASGSGDDQTRE